MPLMDKARIQGFGSDGSKKIWHCPAGHHLQPCKAKVGTCDGCRQSVAKGDKVMKCKQCNWNLCSGCHPQEQEQDWFWGSINYFIETAQQEVTEITEEFKEMADEFETFVSEVATSASCGVSSGSLCKSEEIHLDAAGQPQYKKVAKKDPDRKKKQPSASTKPVKESRRSKSEARQAKEGDQEDGNPGTPKAAASLLRKEKRAARPSGGDGFKLEEGKSNVPSSAPQKDVKLRGIFDEDLLDIGQHDLLDLDIADIRALDAKCGQQLAEGAPLDLLTGEPAGGAAAAGCSNDAKTGGYAPSCSADAEFGGLPLIDFEPTFASAKVS